MRKPPPNASRMYVRFTGGAGVWTPCKCPLSEGGPGLWNEQVGILANLRHPNIVKFRALCLEPACLITEWCAGGSLAETLQKGLTQTDIAGQLSWFRRLVMALEVAKVANLASYTPQI